MIFACCGPLIALVYKRNQINEIAFKSIIFIKGLVQFPQQFSITFVHMEYLICEEKKAKPIFITNSVAERGFDVYCFPF